MPRVPVKILGLSLTPIKGGNCDTMVKEALKSAEMQGDVEVEFITASDKKIAMCQHCQWCIEHRSRCKVDDDANMILDRMEASDGIIYGTPTWNRDACPLWGAFLSRHRSIAFFSQSLRNKAGGFLTCGFLDFGMERALETMAQSTYGVGIILAGRATVLSSTAAFGQRPAYTEHGVLEDTRGMVFVRNVGIRVVELARMIKYATDAGVVMAEPVNLSTGRRIRTTEKVLVDGVWRDKP